MGDILEGSGCAVAAKKVDDRLIQPGIMTKLRFTPLSGSPVQASEHLGNCKAIQGGRVVFQYPT